MKTARRKQQRFLKTSSTLQRKFIDQTEEQAVSILFNQDAPCSLSLFTKETLIAKKSVIFPFFCKYYLDCIVNTKHL